MGLLDKLRRKKEGAITHTADSAESSNLIKLFDKSGAVLYVTKEDYRTKSLPEMLSANRADPEQLSAIVMGSLRDGFFTVGGC